MTSKARRSHLLARRLRDQRRSVRAARPRVVAGVVETLGDSAGATGEIICKRTGAAASPMARSSPRGHEILREPRRERARVVRARVERIHRGPVAAAVLDHEARQAGQGSREAILFAETMQPIALTASASCSSRDGNNLQKNLRRPTRADAATTGIATARSDAGARRADGPALHQPPSLKQRSARLKRPR